MKKKRFENLHQALFRKVELIVANVVLILAAVASAVWFSSSYTGLSGAIQDERVEAMSQIGDIILEKIQLLSDSYSNELSRLSGLLENSGVTTLEEASYNMDNARDICLIRADNTCVLLDGTPVVFSDMPAILKGLTEDVTSFFVTVQAVGEYWVFETGIDGVTLDGIEIAGILRMVESDVYADITTNMIFNDSGTTYVVSPSGVILMRPMNSNGTPNEDAYFKSFNILSDLQQRGVSDIQLNVLRNAFKNGEKAQSAIVIDDVTWLFQSVPDGNGRNILLSVPISITAKDTFEHMQKTILSIILLIVVLALLFLLWIFYFYHRDGQMKIEQAKATSKSDFMNKISHDIRTPLNAIVGMIEIAERSIGKPEAVSECLDSAKKSSEYLIAIINDVLDMSRIENGKLDIAKEPFDLKQLLATVMDMQTTSAKLKELSLVLEDDTPCDVRYVGDSVRIKQCLVNLVSNAIKFTPEGGTITLGCEQHKIDDNRCNLKFTVHDTGIGMSKEFLNNLFIPFEQERNSVTASGTVGSGLGLTIVRHLTELMGGTVSVQSKKGEGSLFVIYLPFEIIPVEDVDLSVAPDDTNTHTLSGKRALLAEDNAINRTIASFFLVDMGFSVEEAENGKIAVDKYMGSENGYYDLILMDIQMPVMDGLEAARQIRGGGRPDSATIPIIALSANAFKEDAEKSHEAGMQVHLPKPIDPNVLETTLYNVLKTRDTGDKENNDEN